MAAMDAPPPHTLTPAEVRALYSALGAASAGLAPAVPTTAVTVAGLPARVYDPEGSSPDGPTMVWYHGGGWVIGDLDSGESMCRHLASRSGVRIVSVDYRLAPEHPFPAAPDDAYASYLAVLGGELGGTPRRLAVGGDSAGGNLSAVVSQMLRDRGERLPDLQVLFYPVTDGAMETTSYKENAEGYMLTAPTMAWFYGHYVGEDEEARLQPYVSPMRAASLAGLPPALIVTAEYDPLRDEGEAYAAALSAAGVTTTLRRFDGQIHGFTSMPEMCGPTAFDALDLAAAHLSRMR
jgi:acetyl esterase